MFKAIAQHLSLPRPLITKSAGTKKRRRAARPCPATAQVEHLESRQLLAATAISDEFKVERPAADSPDRYPYDAAMMEDGRFVIVWTDLPPYVPGYVNFNLYAQRFHADGSKLGEMMTIAATSQFSESQASVAIAPNGNFVVTWLSQRVIRDVDPDRDIEFALYDWQGQRIAGGRVGLPDSAGFRMQESPPDVDMADDGSFVIVAQADLKVAQSELSAMYYRAYDSLGRALTENIQYFNVDDPSGGEKRNPQIAVRPDGKGFVLAYDRTVRIWIDGDPDIVISETKHVQISTYNLDPDTGIASRRTTYTVDGSQESWSPDVAIDPRNRFTVGFVRHTGIGFYTVQMQHFDWNGRLLKQDLEVSRLRKSLASQTTRDRGGSTAPRVSTGEDGSFAITWSGIYDTLFGTSTGVDVFVREYDAFGRRLTTSARKGLTWERVNQRYRTGFQSPAAVTKSADGFVVVFADRDDVFARIYQNQTPTVQLQDWSGNAVSRIVNPDLELTSSAVVHVTDAEDIDAVSVSWHFNSLAWYLDTQFDFRNEAATFRNWGGLDEKWLRSEAGDWYFLTPQGDLYAWTDAAPNRLVQDSTFIASVGADYYDTPGFLIAPSADTQQGRVDVRIQGGGSSYSTTDYIDLVRDRSTGESVVVVQVVAQDESSASDDTVVIASMARMAEHADLSYRLKRPQSDSRNWGGLDEKWITSESGNDWFYILPGGQLYRWEGNAPDPQLDTLIAEFSPEYYEETALLYDAELAVLDRELDFVTGADTSENWAGAEEKWVRTEDGRWYFILPDGDLYHWNGGPKDQLPQNSSFVAHVGTHVYAAPLHLTQGVEIQFDRRYDFSSDVDESFNWAGLQERWTQSADGDWFYTTPDGILWKWNGGPRDSVARNSIAVGTIVATTAVEPELLWRSQLAAADQELNLAADQNYATDWGGLNEKWLQTSNQTEWYFILPNGRLYQWSGDTSRSLLTGSTPVSTFDPDIYASPELLHTAFEDILQLLDG